MTDDDRLVLQAIIAYCSGKLEEAARTPGGHFPTADRHQGYARVRRAARELLEEMEG